MKGTSHVGHRTELTRTGRAAPVSTLVLPAIFVPATLVAVRGTGGI